MAGKKPVKRRVDPVEDEDDDLDVRDPGQSRSRPEQNPPPKPRHSALLIEQARKVGITEEQMADADAADIRYEIQCRRQDAAASYQRQQAQAAAQQQPKPEPEEPEDELEKFGFKKEEYPELYPVIDHLRKKAAAADRAEKRAEKLEKEAEEYKVTLKREKLHNAFSSLPKEYCQRLGKKSIFEVERDSQEAARYWSLLTAAGIDVRENLPSQSELNRALEFGAATIWGPIDEQVIKPVKVKKPPAAEDDADPFDDEDEPARSRKPKVKVGAVPQDADADDLDDDDDEPAAHDDDDDDNEIAARQRQWKNGAVGAPNGRRLPEVGADGKKAAIAGARDDLKKLGLPTDNPVVSREDARAIRNLPD